MFTTSGTYPWSFVTQIFHNGQPSHGGDRQNFELMTSAYPRGTLDSVASLLAATLYLENPDRNSLFSGVRLVRSLVFCVKLYISLFIFFSFGHCIVCFLLFTTSDCPFGTFKPFPYPIFKSCTIRVIICGIYSAVLTFIFSLIPHNIY